MKYLIVQEWQSTKGNHAGMSHMCDLLVDSWPEQYVKICKSSPTPLRLKSAGGLKGVIGKLIGLIYKKKYAREYLKLCKPILKRLTAEDEVFLLEYNWPLTSQLSVAKYIKRHHSSVKILALSHMAPIVYEKINAKKFLLKWSKYVDVEMTLGTNLSKYFVECGISPSKIVTGFHYVDNNYYQKKAEDLTRPSKLTIIAMGAMQRNYELLADVANTCKNVNWIICKGKKTVEHLFRGDHITLVGYVSEDELRRLMDVSDLSFNVMEDTVGSNVIATSLAMGLGVIASDVGAIHDYLDDECAVFCENKKESFEEAINNLVENASRVYSMKKAALHRAEKLSIEKFHEWLLNI